MIIQSKRYGIPQNWAPMTPRGFKTTPGGPMTGPDDLPPRDLDNNPTGGGAIPAGGKVVIDQGGKPVVILPSVGPVVTGAGTAKSTGEITAANSFQLPMIGRVKKSTTYGAVALGLAAIFFLSRKKHGALSGFRRRSRRTSRR